MRLAHSVPGERRQLTRSIWPLLQKKAAESDIDDDEEKLDDLYALPAKKPTAHSPKGKKVSAAKAKAKSVDLDDSDDSDVAPPKKKAPAKAKAVRLVPVSRLADRSLTGLARAQAPAKKAAAPKKKKASSDDDDDLDLSMSDAPAPKARAARSTRAPAKSYQLDLGSDFEGDNSFQISDDGHSEEDAFELSDD